MSRPHKCRRICALPQTEGFIPLGRQEERQSGVTMTVDEYEAIRLIDLEQMTQEQCAVQMQIARTTVTGIYNSARKKLADALVNGKDLRIGGGKFVLCEHRGPGCGGGPAGCCKHNTAGERKQCSSVSVRKER